MKKNTVLIVILALFALIGFGLFFATQSKQDSIAQSQEKKLKDLENQMSQIEKDAQLALEAQEKATQEAMMAAEAQKMAEAKAAQEAAEKQALVKQLNDRLQIEARERREAELAQKELEATLLSLKEAQEAATARLAELESTQVEKSDTSDLRTKLTEQESEIAKLAEENEALKERQQVLLEKQVSTEESIIEAGGKIELPYPEIRSPNYKRRDALYFKQRISGGG